MDNARKKLRVCLICVVMAAVIVGFIYYFNDVKSHNTMSEGTLVRNYLPVGKIRSTGYCEGKDSANRGLDSDSFSAAMDTGAPEGRG